MTEIYYYIDGYNFLFTLSDSQSAFSAQREMLILFLSEQFSLRKLKGALVFDGAIQQGEESGRSQLGLLEIVYTAKKQSADAYIIEQIEGAKKHRQFIVVTNDRGLASHAHALRAKSMSNQKFLNKLSEKKKSEKCEVVETKHNFQRLLKLFEEKLKDQS